jgi:uncharacterized protein YggT (Ycf19 family)
VALAIRLVELALLLVTLDVLLGFVQAEPQRWPRRLTHVLTEPPQALVRRLLPRVGAGQWDLSPLVVIGVLGMLRLWLTRMAM